MSTDASILLDTALLSGSVREARMMRTAVIAMAIRGHLRGAADGGTLPPAIVERLTEARRSLAASEGLRPVKNGVAVTAGETPLAAGPSCVFVRLESVARIEKGRTGIKDAVAGDFPLVVTGEQRLRCDHYDLDGPAAIVPLVSSSGHGDASIKRLHFQEGQFALGTILCAVSSVDESLLSTRFLYEYLTAFKDELLVSRMLGTANVSLTLNKVGEVPVPIVPVEVQRRVVELMDAWGDLETAKEHEDRLCLRLAVSTMQRWTCTPSTPAPDTKCLSFDPDFVQCHVEQLTGHLDGIHQVREHLVVLASRGRLFGSPELWEETTLGQVGKWGSGGTPKKGHPEYYGGTIPWLVIGDLNGGLVTNAEKHITDLGLKNSSAKIIEPGTVLIAMYGSIGKLGVAGIRCATNQAIAFCVPDETRVSQEYLLLLLRGLKTELVDRGHGGTQKNISQTILKSHPILLPPLHEQHTIVERVGALLRLCDEIEAGMRSERRLREQVLACVVHRLMTVNVGEDGTLVA